MSNKQFFRHNHGSLLVWQFFFGDLWCCFVSILCYIAKITCDMWPCTFSVRYICADPLSHKQLKKSQISIQQEQLSLKKKLIPSVWRWNLYYEVLSWTFLVSPHERCGNPNTDPRPDQVRSSCSSQRSVKDEICPFVLCFRGIVHKKFYSLNIIIIQIVLSVA